MSAWGPGAFQNDRALEWLGDVESQDDPTLIDDAIDDVAEAGEGDRLELATCQTALAAAELVAAMGGKRSPRLPDEVAAWAGEQEEPEVELVQSSIAAVGRIRARSELRDSLSEDGDPDAYWLRSLDDLVSRLSAAQTGGG